MGMNGVHLTFPFSFDKPPRLGNIVGAVLRSLGVRGEK